MAYLELRNVSKTYVNGGRSTDVLRSVDLQLDEGEIVAIIGLTGSGKTTLVSMIAGLVEPSGGGIFFRNKPVKDTSLGHGLIFQHYSLLPWLTVLGNVQFAIDELHQHMPRREREQRAIEFIEKVNLQTALHKFPAELSGGMKQRVAVARTLAANPDVLLMDEPLSALDALTRSNLQDEILDILHETKKTAVLITNNVDEAIIMADRIIPLLPAPASTLGKSFRVSINKEAGFKRQLNKSKQFNDMRSEIVSYLNSYRNAN